MYHLSADLTLDGKILYPRVPEYVKRSQPNETKFEDAETERVCFCEDIDGGLNSIFGNINPQCPVVDRFIAVYITEKKVIEYKRVDNIQIIKNKLVWDANLTTECWIVEPVKLILYGIIEIRSISFGERHKTILNKEGKCATRPEYWFEWAWHVAPQIFDDYRKHKDD